MRTLPQSAQLEAVRGVGRGCGGRAELSASSNKPGEHLLVHGCGRAGTTLQLSRLLPPTSSPTLVRPPPLPPVLTCPWWGGRGTCSGWLTAALLCACCWPSSCWAVEGVANPVCPGAEHPRGRVGYLLKASCGRVPIPDIRRAGQGSWLGDTWPRMWAPLCSGSGPWRRSSLSRMGQCLYPNRSRQRLLQDDVWGRAHAWAGQPRSAGGLHRHQATGGATWELASAVLGVAAAGSWPGLKGCSSPAPSNRPSVRRRTAGHLAPWSSCSHPANIGFLPSLPLPLFSPK